ncbi:uncharacterized protein LOC143036154 [Oratosquilla oratoria]|uniref:uncharacterized protein LOC143036154 n=1 Tax=Oratosquilla oratoria TaxID=337810 RepID=UPI003F768303
MILNENGMNCAMLGLPEPISEPSAIQHMEEIQEVNPEVLNIEQRYVFNIVINAVSEIDRGLETNHRLFYLDAPGGSGKTFLFNMIHDYLVAQNVAVSTSAWTGIAATLLKNGKTLHSIFKLPVPLTETITCNIAPNSDQNMRTNENEQVFSQWLLQIGNGRVQSSLDNVSDDTINIPEQCVCIDSLVSDIFDNCTQDEMKSRVILSPKNVDCLKVNEDILRRLPTESKTYLSIDSVSSDNEMEANNYPIEFINSLTPSGMPPHRLNLKVGSIIMLLRNLSITQGLCNGTRLEVLKLHNHSILASIMIGSHAQERVLIPRIKLNPSDSTSANDVGLCVYVGCQTFRLDFSSFPSTPRSTARAETAVNLPRGRPQSSSCTIFFLGVIFCLSESSSLMFASELVSEFENHDQRTSMCLRCNFVKRNLVTNSREEQGVSDFE